MHEEHTARRWAQQAGNGQGSLVTWLAKSLSTWLFICALHLLPSSAKPSKIVVLLPEEQVQRGHHRGGARSPLPGLPGAGGGRGDDVLHAEEPEGVAGRRCHPGVGDAVVERLVIVHGRQQQRLPGYQGVKGL